MIIQALNEQYEQLRKIYPERVPSLGFAIIKAHFCIVLDRDGAYVTDEYLKDGDGEVLSTIAPMAAGGSCEVAPNFMWDNTSYVLGVDSKGKEKHTLQCWQAFKAFHRKISDSVDDAGLVALVNFLDAWKPENIESLKYANDIKKGGNIIFRFDGEREYFHKRKSVQAEWEKIFRERFSKEISMCLVTGIQKPIARTHPTINSGKDGVWNAQSRGGSLVSFNEDSFRSYSKAQSFNAPVSEEAAFNYATALNYLLQRDNRQRIQIGDTTTVFWAEGKTPVVGFLKYILDPDENSPNISGLRNFLEAVREGRKPELSDTENLKFYILGISPNRSRLSIRFWYVSSVEDISKKIGQHFSNLQIDRAYDDEPEYPGLWRLLIETLPKRGGQKRKSEDISPLLAGAFARAILTGCMYPTSLVAQVIERLRADGDISYYRAALIKAYLVRSNRILKKNQKEVSMSLDKEQRNTGYLLGRLFAVLEKAQKDAIPGANATIKGRFYGSASATPSVVFPQLLRLAQHHIQKSQYGGLIEKSIEEITEYVQVFPAHLNLEDQGMFALGYYHQKPEMYKKTEKKEEE